MKGNTKGRLDPNVSFKTMILQKELPLVLRTSVNENTNSEILSALNAVSFRLMTIEQGIDRTEEQLQSRPKVADDAFGVVDRSTSFQEADEAIDAGDDAVIPNAQFLNKTKHIQGAVDQRLQELVHINEQGGFKSQRGGNEQINVYYQVPFPQNNALAGTSKSRVTYDSISTFQWMAGFCSIIREQKDTKVKKCNA